MTESNSRPLTSSTATSVIGDSRPCVEASPKGRSAAASADASSSTIERAETTATVPPATTADSAEARAATSVRSLSPSTGSMVGIWSVRRTEVGCFISGAAARSMAPARSITSAGVR